MKSSIRVIFVFLLAPLLTISCGQSYITKKEISAGEVTYFDNSKAEKSLCIEISPLEKNIGIMKILLMQNKRIPKYAADNYKVIEVSGRRPDIFFTALLPFSTYFGDSEDVKKGLGTKDERLVEEIRRNVRFTGESKDETSPLGNHPLSVKIDSSFNVTLSSSAAGIVMVPIKTLARKLPYSPEKLLIDLETEFDGKMAQRQLLLNQQDINMLGLDLIIWQVTNETGVVSNETKEMERESKGFSLVQKLVKKRIANALDEQFKPLKDDWDKLKTDQPKPPRLEKNQFESTQKFNERVAQAKVEYDSEVEAYNRRVHEVGQKIYDYYTSHRGLPVGMRNQIIEDTFLDVFDRPKLINGRYNADTGIFFVDIVSVTTLAGDFKKTLALAETTPNEKAKDFYDSLEYAYPRIEFKLNDDQISWNKAEVFIGEQAFPANLIDTNFTPIDMRPQIAEAELLTGFDLTGLSPLEFQELIKNGFTFKEMQKWRELGVKVSEATKWLRIGLDADSVRPYIQAGFSPLEYNEWLNAGFSSNEALEWKSNGVALSLANKFRAKGYNAALARWIKGGFNPAEANKWINSNYTYDSALAWKNAGFDYDKALTWLREGFTPQEAKENIFIGIKEALKDKSEGSLPKKYRGQCNGTILSIVDFITGKNPYADKGKCALITAGTFQMTSEKTGLFTVGNEVLYVEFPQTFRGPFVCGIAKIMGVYTYESRLGTNTVPHLQMIELLLDYRGFGCNQEYYELERQVKGRLR